MSLSNNNNRRILERKFVLVKSRLRKKSNKPINMKDYCMVQVKRNLMEHSSLFRPLMRSLGMAKQQTSKNRALINPSFQNKTLNMKSAPQLEIRNIY